MIWLFVLAVASNCYARPVDPDLVGETLSRNTLTGAVVLGNAVSFRNVIRIEWLGMEEERLGHDQNKETTNFFFSNFFLPGELSGLRGLFQRLRNCNSIQHAYH